MGILLVPNGVSAGTTKIVVQDRTGDLGPKIDWETGDIVLWWPDTTSLTKVGYFDILSFSLSYKAKTYTFGMEVAADLPKEGSPLPTGFKALEWLMWIDPEPWNMKYNNILSLYSIKLVYYELEYFAFIQDYATGEVLASLPFTIDGSKLQVEFTASSIGNLESFWFMPCTVVRWSIAGYWDLDSTDPGAAPGQVWWDIPWPPQ
ncbi:MAG: hypothetical protein A3K60_00035 [Euryarchaeota archaeon RBG_19FT_COMBO_56_21]|nr:MAG: hypothetical protein A3K60_00035 [Euryarchaeota archaeon RBG_19FT_COMBO_56_21]